MDLATAGGSAGALSTSMLSAAGKGGSVRVAEEAACLSWYAEIQSIAASMLESPVAFRAFSLEICITFALILDNFKIKLKRSTYARDWSKPISKSNDKSADILFWMKNLVHFKIKCK